MPLALGYGTDWEHIDWMMTSPEAIRLTLSSKLFQNARNWPACLVSIRKAMVLSISGFVMLPLSAYLRVPRDSMTIAASIIPIDGMLRIDALPLNAGSTRSFQLAILRPTRSGRIPNVSAL